MDRESWWAIVHGVTKKQDTTERLTLSLFLVRIFHLHQHFSFMVGINSRQGLEIITAISLLPITFHQAGSISC